ncbi:MULTISPECIES: hypothetical protein [Thermus]|uniref:Uncharacterized protein n=1 Tax=Thermus scotoductus TaxID=37636 RepID=A0A430UZV2_THESC|nr:MULTISPECIES: hypothetical protein [Thermus]RTI15308.1 hypothetical protein CSW27_06080 [Thermus scotoductus]
MRLLLAAALAALIGAASSSLAAGRAACRLDYPWRAACYAEEEVMRLGPLGVVAGLEARYPEGLFPYVGVLFQDEGVWAALLVGVNFYSLSVGFAWR